MRKIRVIELFAGYGSQHLALKRLKRDYPEFEYEVVAFCEIDENAIKAYHALHGDHIPNLGDITQVNPSDVPDCDLMTWSFPCQSISSAGLQHGLAEGSGTRSSLCWNAVRIFEAKRPKYLLMENVSALVSDKFIGDFNLLQSSLQKIGYTNFTQLMNAKDYGVPQNRLRVFMVSVLDCQQAYYFPKPFPLEKRLKDVLETNVPDRYYLSDAAISRLQMNVQKTKGDNAELCVNQEKEARTNCASLAKRTTFDNYIQEPAIKKLGYYSNSQAGLIVSTNGISPAIINGDHAGTPKIAEPCTAAVRGRSDGEWHSSEHQQRLELGSNDTSNASNGVAKDAMVVEPAILQPVRTEEEKQRRHIQGDKGARFQGKELQPRQDGCSNTISTVSKDNLLAEPQVLGWTRDAQGNITDRHPVDVANCVTANKRDNTQNYVQETIKIQEYEQTGIFETINEANTRKVLCLLWQKVGEKTFYEKMGRLRCFQEKEVLQSGLHEKGVCDTGTEQPRQWSRSPLVTSNSTHDRAEGTEMRSVRQSIDKVGCSSQRRELPQQFIREFIACLSQLPHETPQTEKCLRYLRQADGRWTWLLQQTLYTLEEVRKSINGERAIGYRIRRLTERELFRLQDVDEPDIDTLLNAGISNTQLAKLAGNSIVTACMYHIFNALFIETTPPPNTQTQLF